MWKFLGCLLYLLDQVDVVFVKFGLGIDDGDH